MYTDNYIHLTLFLSKRLPNINKICILALGFNENFSSEHFWQCRYYKSIRNIQVIKDKMFENLLQLANQHQLIPSANFTQYFIYRAQKKADGSINTLSDTQYEGQVGQQIDDEKLDSFHTKSSDLFKEKNIEKQFKLIKTLGVGGKFPDCGQLKKVLQQGTGTLKASPGQVMLVDVWATWCGPCQKPMAHNQQMLKKNKEKWGNKVRIVGVSVDDSIQTVKQRVKDKNWQLVEHFCIQGWKHDHKIISSFQISGIPFVCLVDGQGIINFCGHPSQINLQERINQLAGFSEKAAPKIEETVAKIDMETLKKIRQLLQKDKFKEWTEKCQQIIVTCSGQQKISEGKVSSRASIFIMVFKKDQNIIDWLKEQTNGLKGIQIKQKIIEQIDVPKADNCSSCGKELGEFYYWCYWSGQNNLRCRSCVEAKNNNGQYNFFQNSILVNKTTEKIYKSRIGKNLQPQKQQGASPPNYMCNCCGECPSAKVARYVSLGTRDQFREGGDFDDICQPCMQKYIAGDQESRKSVPSSNHAFVRVLYNVKGYYEY